MHFDDEIVNASEDVEAIALSDSSVKENTLEVVGK